MPNEFVIEKDKPFAQEGYDLMAAAFEVHRELGGGLSEEIYQQSLEIELRLRSIPFNSKIEQRVFYKGQGLSTYYIPDLILHGQIVAELKAVKELAPEHEAQLVNYMRIAQRPVGYLVNFGPISKVQWKRFVISEFLQPKPVIKNRVGPNSGLPSNFISVD